MRGCDAGSGRPVSYEVTLPQITLRGIKNRGAMFATILQAGQLRGAMRRVKVPRMHLLSSCSRRFRRSGA
jgi:hypothetical protein